MIFKPRTRPGRSHYFRLSPAEVEEINAAHERARAQHRAQIAADIARAHANASATRAALDEQYHSQFEDDDNTCDTCAGEGVIEYLEAGPSYWGEDCPSEENHLVTCRDCQGTGSTIRHSPLTIR